MNGGRTVLMRFSDGSKGPVPVGDVRAAREAGAELVKTGMYGRPTPQGLAASLADFLPTAGSMGGSIAGGIGGAAAGSAVAPGPGTVAGGVAGRMAGGVAGGVAGKAAQEGVYRALGYGDAPGTLGSEAAFQGTAGLAGEAIGGAAGLVGRGLIRTGLPARLAEARTVIEEMVKNRIPIGGPGLTRGSTVANVPVVGPALQKGSAEAKREWLERTASRNAVNQAAEAQGVLIPRQAATDALEKVLNEASKEMADDAEVAYFRRVLDSWRRRASDFLAPSEAQRIITRYNVTTRSVDRALKAGKSVPEDALQQKAAVRRPIAAALGKEMEARVPGWKEYSTKLGRSIALKEGINAAENQSVRTLGSRLATGGAVAGGLDFARGERDQADLARSGLIGAGAMASPALLSRAGLLFTDPLLQMILRQSPRAYGTTEGE